MAVSILRLDEPAIKAFMARPGGPVQQIITRATVHVPRAAVVGAPKDTGLLSQSIQMTVVPTPAGPVGFVYTRLKRAVYVLKGTRPHMIRPRTKRALRFPVNGSAVFSRSAQHPGTKANDFLRRALLVLNGRRF